MYLFNMLLLFCFKFLFLKIYGGFSILFFFFCGMVGMGFFFFWILGRNFGLLNFRFGFLFIKLKKTLLLMLR